MERAVPRVLDDPPPGEEVSRTEEFRQQLEALGHAVRQAATGERPLLERGGLPASGDRLVRRLRTATLDEIAERGGAFDTRHLISLLRAFDAVEHALDFDDAYRFAGQLTGARGLELLVEVAHDLRSPLASILFLAETLRKAHSGPVTAVQERQLGLVYGAAFGLSAMASDVIELVRGGERLVSGAPVPFSVAALMHSVRDIVQPIAEEKGLALQLVLPDADFRLGHPGALSRVLLNLTTNALKFTAEGHVEIAARQHTRTHLEFSVQDTGRGIPPEVMSCLFDAFRRRRDAATYAFSSAGLGLSICRKLVRAMGSELAVESSEGAGTRFYFQLDLPAAPRI